MADATKLVKLGIAKIGTPESKKSRVLTPMSATGTILVSTVALKDDDDANLVTPFVLGVKYASGDYKGYIENVTVTALDTTGTQCTVVRGIERTGTDYLTGNTDLAKSIPKDSLIEVVYSVQQQEMLIKAIYGEIATGGNSWFLGDGTNVDKIIKSKFESGDINFLKQSSDGTISIYVSGGWSLISSLASHGNTALIKEHGDVNSAVSDSSADGDFLVKGATEWENQTPETGDAFVKTPSVYTPAFLTGGTNATSTFADWQSITDGSFRITIDGTQRDITGLDFSSVADMNGVASVIQAGIRTATSSTETCVWSTDHFVVSSANTTSTSAITVGSATGGGTDISGAGGTDFMDCDAGNGTITEKQTTGLENKIPVIGVNNKISSEILPDLIPVVYPTTVYDDGITLVNGVAKEIHSRTLNSFSLGKALNICGRFITKSNSSTAYSISISLDIKINDTLIATVINGSVLDDNKTGEANFNIDLISTGDNSQYLSALVGGFNDDNEPNSSVHYTALGTVDVSSGAELTIDATLGGVSGSLNEAQIVSVLN